MPRILGGQRIATSTLLVTIIVAVALRLASALFQGDVVAALPGIHDQISYDALARQVLNGKGFSFPTSWWPATAAGEPTAHWSYLYSLYLAGMYALFGLHPLVARLIQAVIAGILQPWLTWRIGSRVFGERVGLIAAILSAMYAYFVYYGGALMTETFYILTLLWAIDLATGVVHERDVQVVGTGARTSNLLKTLQPWLMLGVAMGLAALFRQLILLVVPFLFVWLLWAAYNRHTSRRPGFPLDRLRPVILGLVCTTLVMFALIVPWTVRNYQVFDRFVLLNTNAGYALFWANHPIHGTDFTPILPNGVYIDLIPKELWGLDEAALDQALLREGLRFVFDDPTRFAQLSLSRVQDYFAFLPSEDSGSISNLARALSFGVLFPFVLFGLFLSVVHHRRYVLAGGSPAFVLLCVFAAVYSLIHLLSWALVRYRLPVDAILIEFAALGIVNLGMWLVRGPLLRLQRTV